MRLVAELNPMRLRFIPIGRCANRNIAPIDAELCGCGKQLFVLRDHVARQKLVLIEQVITAPYGNGFAGSGILFSQGNKRRNNPIVKSLFTPFPKAGKLNETVEMTFFAWVPLSSIL